jgi:alkylhydroperoxidase/carboxymuconolactone decarboxylase family protein YurZ
MMSDDPGFGGAGLDESAGPVFETLAAMTTASLENTSLDAQTLVLVRIAALAAVGAPAASYLLHLGAGQEVGLTLEDVEGVLVGVAPIIGSPRVVAASDAIHDALGFAVAVAEADVLMLDDELGVDD